MSRQWSLPLSISCAFASGIRLSRKPATMKKITTLKSQMFACCSLFFMTPSFFQLTTTIAVSMERQVVSDRWLKLRTGRLLHDDVVEDPSNCWASIHRWSHYLLLV